MGDCDEFTEEGEFEIDDEFTGAVGKEEIILGALLAALMLGKSMKRNALGS